MDYKKFLMKKVKTTKKSGFTSKLEFNKNLFPFQKYTVEWALMKGKAAVFAECGLGKTLVQIEWAHHVVEKTKKSVLILAPLAVSGQTIQEGVKFGIAVEKWCKQDYVGTFITNYEQLKNFTKKEISSFSGIVLDESSILKNFTGQIKRLIIDTFQKTPYKLACTATPSPNDHMELGNHSDFLNVMPSNEMLSRWFINDTMNFGGYRVKKHGEDSFWLWVASWAMCISKPSDIGFSDDGYDLEEIEYKEIKVIVPPSSGQLFADSDVNATSFNKSLRLTKEERLQRAAEIAMSSDEPCIIWVNQNEEADYMKKLLPSEKTIEVRGSEKPEIKESKLLNFANTNDYQFMITKKKIAQFGMNFQRVNRQVFASLDFSFEGLYQAIRRSYRFGQTKKVTINIITTNTMKNVIHTIHEKEIKFNDMREKMSKSMKKALDSKKGKLELLKDFDHKTKETDNWIMHNGDCVDVMKDIPDNSLDFSIFSPPFANLYIYSDSVRDMGNCKNDNEFFKQFKYLIKELKRTLRSGRLVAVHSKNLVNYMNTHGKSGQRDFRGEIIRAFTNEGFSFHSEVTIWKDPVIEMQRTKAHGLLYKQLRADSSYTRNGMSEYLTIFRKWSENEEEKELEEKIDWKTHDNFILDKWQQVASPVWDSKPTRNDLIETLIAQNKLLKDLQMRLPIAQRQSIPVWDDIAQTKVLNIKEARSGNDEKHICPLQLDVIEKAVELWTNPGDVVFSPFAGIGSEGYQSLKLGRKFLGIELKPEYFEKACKNLKEAEKENGQFGILDFC